MRHLTAATLEIREYLESGRSPFGEWFEDLDSVTAARIDRHLRRLENGNIGSVKSLRDGVFELRMDFGPGYRVYFGRAGTRLIVLVGGGTKRRQPSDIALAVSRWKQFKNNED